MQHPWLVLLAFAAGALLSAQGPILTRIAFHAGGPIQAATVAFAIGLCVLLAAGILAGTGVPRLGDVMRMPVWLWAGGLIGTGLLLLTLYAVPRIGLRRRGRLRPVAGGARLRPYRRLRNGIAAGGATRNRRCGPAAGRSGNDCRWRARLSEGHGPGFRRNLC